MSPHRLPSVVVRIPACSRGFFENPVQPHRRMVSDAPAVSTSPAVPASIRAPSSSSAREHALFLFHTQCLWNGESPHLFKPAYGVCNSKVLQNARAGGALTTPAPPQGYIITMGGDSQVIRICVHDSNTLSLSEHRSDAWVPVTPHQIVSTDDLLLVLAWCVLVLRIEPRAFSANVAFYRVSFVTL